MKDKFTDRIDAVDAEVLRELSRGKKRVFEFGTFVGGSAMAMLPQIKEAGGHLWCIDHFRDDVYGPPQMSIAPSEVISQLITRVDSYHQIITIIVGDLTEARNFPSGFADLVFIDASHNYSMVKRDIELALHLCRLGGTICGHDYVRHYDDCDLELLEQYADFGSGFFEGVGYGVIKAVHEYFGSPNNRGGVWWVDR